MQGSKVSQSAHHQKLSARRVSPPSSTLLQLINKSAGDHSPGCTPFWESDPERGAFPGQTTSKQDSASGRRDTASKLAMDVKRALRIGRKAEMAAAEAAAEVMI